LNLFLVKVSVFFQISGHVGHDARQYYLPSDDENVLHPEGIKVGDRVTHVNNLRVRTVLFELFELFGFNRLNNIFTLIRCNLGFTA
jgi:hypothetical protein